MNETKGEVKMMRVMMVLVLMAGMLFARPWVYNADDFRKPFDFKGEAMNVQAITGVAFGKGTEKGLITLWWTPRNKRIPAGVAMEGRERFHTFRNEKQFMAFVALVKAHMGDTSLIDGMQTKQYKPKRKK